MIEPRSKRAQFCVLYYFDTADNAFALDDHMHAFIPHFPHA